MERPICVDCKHCVLGTGQYSEPMCGLTKTVTRSNDLVYRHPDLISYTHCFTERNIGQCGVDGKNFTPKHKLRRLFDRIRHIDRMEINPYDFGV